MSGFYRMKRGWQDHPVFGNEAFSRRDAWEWMIANAAYQAHDVGVIGKRVRVERGQLLYSLRYLARAWQWDDAKVRRFLSRLEKEEMIDAATDAGVTRLTIRNYDDYQAPESKADAPTEGQPTRHRRSTDANKKEGKEGNLRASNEALSRDADFDVWYKAYPLHKAPDAARKAYDVARRKGATAEQLLAGAVGYARECAAKGTEKAFIAHPATWLNRGDWRESPADLSHAEPAADPERSQARAMMRGYKPGGFWPSGRWGSRPGEPGCLVPEDILAEFGYSLPARDGPENVVNLDSLIEQSTRRVPAWP